MIVYFNIYLRDRMKSSISLHNHDTFLGKNRPGETFHEGTKDNK